MIGDIFWAMPSARAIQGYAVAPVLTHQALTIPIAIEACVPMVLNQSVVPAHRLRTIGTKEAYIATPYEKNSSASLARSSLAGTTGLVFVRAVHQSMSLEA